MALKEKEVRVQVPDNLNVILEVLAEEAGDSKVGFASDIVCDYLQKHFIRHHKVKDGLTAIGLQSELLDRRGFSEKKEPRE